MTGLAGKRCPSARVLIGIVCLLCSLLISILELPTSFDPWSADSSSISFRKPNSTRNASKMLQIEAKLKQRASKKGPAFWATNSTNLESTSLGFGADLDSSLPHRISKRFITKTHSRDDPPGSITENENSTMKTHKFLHGCNAELFRNASLFRASLKWTRRTKEQEWRLQIAGCNLDQINVEMARKCIATSSPGGIHFIGDSLTRYQYLNLAYFLTTGSWSSDKAQPNERQGSFRGGWKQFYKVTNERMRGYEICDCFRGTVKNSLENRYFEEPTSGAKLSYMLIFGPSHRIRIHKRALLIRNCKVENRGGPVCKQGLCSPGSCSAGSQKQSDTKSTFFLNGIRQEGALSTMVKVADSSDVLFNVGRHYYDPTIMYCNLFANENRLTDLKREVEKVRAGGMQTKFHWMMSIRRPDCDPEYEFAKNLTDRAGFTGIYDRYALTETLYEAARKLGVEKNLSYDKTHFQPQINAELNKALVAYICSRIE